MTALTVRKQYPELLLAAALSSVAITGLTGELLPYAAWIGVAIGQWIFMILLPLAFMRGKGNRAGWICLALVSLAVLAGSAP